MSRRIHVPRHRHGRIAAVSAALVLAVSPLAAVPAAAEERLPAGVETGSLVWGVKGSWAGDGATVTEAGVVTFPLVSGEFDADTGATRLQFAGSVHYRKYCDFFDYQQPGECALDLRLSDPQVVITADEQVLSAELSSRPQGTGADPNPPIVDYGVVEVVALDITDATLDTGNGTTTWSGVKAFLTDTGSDAFAYPPGQAFEPLTFTYDGPGGMPDLGETWDVPGGVGLVEDVRWSGTTTIRPESLFVDSDDSVLHMVTPFVVAEDRAFVRAFDSTTLEPVDTARYEQDTSQGSSLGLDYDERGNTLFASYQHQDAATGSVTSRVVALTYDADEKTYSEAVVDDLPAADTFLSAARWDAQRDRLVGYVAVTDPETFQQRVAVWTWTRAGDGTWQRREHALPDAPGGFGHAAWYGATGISGQTSPVALAADGSLVIARGNARPTLDWSNLVDATALRIVVPDEGDAQVSEIAGTGTNQIVTDVNADPALANGYTMATAGDDGTIWLLSASTPHRALPATVALDGSGVTAGDPVDLPADVSFYGAAVDPVNGTLWAKSALAGRLVGVRGSGIVFDDVYTDFVWYSTVAVDDHHNVYSLSRLPTRYPNILRLAYTGTVPLVTAQPADAEILHTDATFTVTADGDPDPEVQWQERRPGAQRFTDLPGRTDPTLTVTAAAAPTTGTEYRAVLSNTAGAIASDPATLTVLAAPAITLEPVSRTVGPGARVTFQVLASGNPEPSISWERQVDGAWVPATGDGVTADGGTLTIEKARSSERFRAKVGNEHGTVYSDVATLTVQGPTVNPDGSVTGAPNATGATTTVRPGIDLPADQATTLEVTGDGFVKNTNTTGAAVLFGYVSTFPSEGGEPGDGYDYLTGPDGEQVIAWPGSGAADGVFDDDGGFHTGGLTAQPVFEAASGATVNCVVGQVQCGVITIGAAGSPDANLETFTPVYFTGQEPPTPTLTAPAVSTHPASVTVDEGENATFIADATGNPVPAVRWQSRSTGAWTDLPNATETTYTVRAAALTASGTQYRAVFTNSEGTAITEPATLTVRTEPPPGEPGGPGEPGEPADPGEPGAAGPSEADLTPETRGLIDVPDTATAGSTITVGIPTADPDDRVTAYLFSDPVSLGSRTVDSRGDITVVLPADVTGPHRLAVYGPDDELIGWDTIEITPADDTGPDAGDGDLPDTGNASATRALALGTLLLVAGLAIILTRRRARAGT